VIQEIVSSPSWVQNNLIRFIVVVDGSPPVYTSNDINAAGNYSNTSNEPAISVDYTAGGSSDTPLTVDNGSGVGQGFDVALLFGEAYVLPVTGGQGTTEGQEIPFALAQPGSEGSAVGAGQNIDLLTPAVIVLDSGSGAGAGQDIGLLVAGVIVLESGSGVGAGQSVDLSLTVTITPASGRAREARRAGGARGISFVSLTRRGRG
jgi:hypothetical protein